MGKAGRVLHAQSRDSSDPRAAVCSEGVRHRGAIDKQSESGGIAKDGAKLVTAVATAKVQSEIKSHSEVCEYAKN